MPLVFFPLRERLGIFSNKLPERAGEILDVAEAKGVSGLRDIHALAQKQVAGLLHVQLTVDLAMVDAAVSRRRA